MVECVKSNDKGLFGSLPGMLGKMLLCVFSFLLGEKERGWVVRKSELR
jgi:hypothetical protein